MIRFCQEHTAIGHIDLLPEWLSDYVKYDNPKALPQFFVDNADLHTLRVCLGMYPDEDIADKSKIPQPLVQVLNMMPVWYQSKIT